MGFDKRRRSRKPLSLKIARLRMTDAVKVLEKIIQESEDAYTRINAINALSGLLTRYAKITETEELERRIQALEEQNKVLGEFHE